ncbi:hypothetical protein ACFHYR_01900 [Pasteurella multocida]
MNKYEALGRYTEAKEEFDKLKQRRTVFANKIAETAQYLSSSNTKNLQEKTLEISEMLNQLTVLNDEALELVDQINQYAEICERPKVS